MGRTNVALVYLQWAHLPDRPFRLLAYMALVSLDTDCPPCYFGGHSALARALGKDTPDRLPENASEADKKALRNDLEAVRVALKVVLQKGAAEIVEAEAPGRHPRYALRLGLDGPGLPRTTIRGYPGDDPGLPRQRPGVTPVDLGGVGGETLEQKEPRGEGGISGGNNVRKVSTSPANVDEKRDEKTELQRQQDELHAKYPHDFREKK